VIVSPLTIVFEQYKSTLAGLFEGTLSDVTEENLQARIRGNLLMAVSNKFGCLVLTTGNKSEMGLRLLHLVRRHGGWVCGYKRCSQDNRLQAVGLPQLHFASYSGDDHHPSSYWPNCVPTRRIRTPFRPMTFWMDPGRLR